jgi:CubicO group peptidase (beta-lactamase class C family)
VSIRHLLTHTSGIADYMDLALKEYFSLFAKIEFYMNQSMVNLFYNGSPSEYKNHYTILTSEDVLNMVGKYRGKRLFLSGEKYLYSNTGYVILSLVVEAVSGQTFESFLDKEIFIPLDMENSSFWNLFTKPDKLSNRVQGTNGKRLNDYSWMDGVSGDGAVFLSIEDFLKWDKALKKNSLVPQSEFDKAMDPFISSVGDTTYYGFGWSLSKEGTSISHGGSWLGAVTYIYRKLDTDAMFVLLESSTSKYSYVIRKEIQRVLNRTEPHMFSWDQIVVPNF